MELKGADKYDVKKVEELEKNVDEQVSSNTYDLEANLALVRFYQFFPNKVQVDKLAKVLLKALAQLPRADYKMCIHLVPDRLQSDDVISKVTALASALETARFPEFWALTANCKDLLNSIPGFYDSVRAYVLHVLCITFQRVPKKYLAECLRLEGATLDNMVSEKVKSSGWGVQSCPGGDLVLLPKTEHNQQTQKRTQELVKFDQVAPVLQKLTVGF